MTSTNLTKSVCVIIPAYNAESTITDAISSALDQNEVSEVIVVDDASADGTANTANKLSEKDARVKVFIQSENQGPSAARNIALQHSTAPYIAILDSDDYFLPNRFTHLLREGDFDLIADNIVFVPENRQTLIKRAELSQPSRSRSTALSTQSFIEGNIPRKGKSRGELGFLKPIISRSFLEKYSISYNENMRLGEDFDLYIRMFANGANFRVTKRIGYVARVRSNSLSGRHSADDLKNLYDASLAHLEDLNFDVDVQNTYMKYLTHLEKRYLLHKFLEVKNSEGWRSALHFATTPFRHFGAIACGIAKDKFETSLRPSKESVPDQRYLLPL